MEPLNAKTRQQMADEYHISRKTFYNRLKKEEIQLKKGLILPKEQKVIYEKLGKPKGLRVQERQ